MTGEPRASRRPEGGGGVRRKPIAWDRPSFCYNCNPARDACRQYKGADGSPMTKVLAKSLWIASWVFSTTAVLASSAGQPSSSPNPSVPLGYRSQTWQPEGDWENKFRERVNPGNIRENLRRLSARPHNVGSPYDKDNAEWILS